MIRVVLDTNIIVSALLQPLGPPAQVLLLAVRASTVQMSVSGSLYAEYEEVIRRPKFKRTEETIRSVLFAIRAKGHWVRPTVSLRVCSDPDDDVVLECALAGSARYVVTGNTKHFPADWAHAEIVTPRDFLELVAGD